MDGFQNLVIRSIPSMGPMPDIYLRSLISYYMVLYILVTGYIHSDSPVNNLYFSFKLFFCLQQKN